MKRFLSCTLCIASLLSCTDSASDPNPSPLESRSSINDTIITTKVQPSDSQLSVDSLITVEYLMGKFDYRKHPSFAKIPDSLSNKEIYLRKDVIEAFTAMYEEAMKENVPLSVVSGTRNFNEQKSIWENKWKKESTNNLSARETAIKILAYSSMPSTSRHHWGTDIDINSVESEYFRSEPGISAYNWLAKNANRFGFYQTYTSKENGRTGYSVEEWHWSYLPLATHYLQLYNQKISNSDIVGFSGCETATEIDILKNYVNGVEKY